MATTFIVVNSRRMRARRLALLIGTIEITVFDDGIAPAAEIGIDDLGFRVGIFFDGFETGDSSSWSSHSL